MRTASLCNSAIRTASSSVIVRGAVAVMGTVGGDVGTACAPAIAGISAATGTISD